MPLVSFYTKRNVISWNTQATESNEDLSSHPQGDHLAVDPTHKIL